MGVATGLVNFTRQLGGVFGVAVGAALMLTTLTSRLTELLPGAHIKAAELLSPAAAARFPAETQDLVRGAFADALHVVFVAALVIVLVGMLTVALMPGGKPAAIRDAAHARAARGGAPRRRDDPRHAHGRGARRGRRARIGGGSGAGLIGRLGADATRRGGCHHTIVHPADRRRGSRGLTTHVHEAGHGSW